jgi:hypothetical protein
LFPIIKRVLKGQRSTTLRPSRGSERHGTCRALLPSSINGAFSI